VENEEKKLKKLSKKKRMFNYKSVCLLAVVGLLGSCKVKQEIPQNRPMLAMPQKFMKQADSLQVGLPTARVFFKDSTLISLIDSAISNNFDLQIALQKIEMARAGVRFTQGLGKPDLAGNFAVGQRKFGKYTIDGVGNFDTDFSTNISEKQRIPKPIVPDFYLGVQSSWEIDIWGN